MANSLFPSSSSRKRIFEAMSPDIPLSKRRLTLSASSENSIESVQRMDTSETASHEVERVEWDKAWHTAIAFLTFPDKELRLREDQGDLSRASRRWLKRPPSQAVLDSIQFVKSHPLRDLHSRPLVHDGNIQLWFFDEIRRHFLLNFKPALIKVVPSRSHMFGANS